MQKEPYQTPQLLIHERLCDITAGASGRTGAAPRTFAGDRLLITQPRLPRL